MISISTDVLDAVTPAAAHPVNAGRVECLRLFPTDRPVCRPRKRGYWAEQRHRERETRAPRPPSAWNANRYQRRSGSLCKLGGREEIRKSRHQQRSRLQHRSRLDRQNPIRACAWPSRMHQLDTGRKGKIWRTSLAFLLQWWLLRCQGGWLKPAPFSISSSVPESNPSRTCLPHLPRPGRSRCLAGEEDGEAAAWTVAAEVVLT